MAGYGAPVLWKMDLVTLTTNWRPGSHDTSDDPDGANLEWNWKYERIDVFTNPEQVERTIGVLRRVAKEGIGFLDYIAPILLGSDGRVWDGHHRICIALALGLEYVMVELA